MIDKAEYWRIILVLFITLLGGMLSGYWWASWGLTLSGYVIWLLRKIYQIDKWLTHNAKDSFLPEVDGIWHRIVRQIHSIQQKSNRRKKRMSKLFKRFQGIITSLPYATVVLNGNNEIDWANELSTKHLGIDIKKNRGQRIDNLIRVPGLYEKLTKNANQELEVSLPRGSGDKLAIQLIRVNKDLKLLIARDISAQVNIQRMRKNFIANASHELRTPLTIIAGYLEIMHENQSLPKDIRIAVATATEQSNRMQRIIEDLLTLSRLESSLLDGKKWTIIDVPTLLYKLCDNASTLLSDNSHTITTDIDSKLKLNGTEDEIMSLCSNLLYNAIHHTQVATNIFVTWRHLPTGEACLTVKDDGVGIPAPHVSRLTERFYRVDKGRSAKKGGTGLGLAIVQHIVRRHGGRLNIQSTIGKGTSFIVCFPANITH